MSKFNGTVQKMILKGTPNKEFQNTLDISLSINVADIPSTDRDSGGWEEVLQGLRSASAKMTGRTNYVTTAGKAGIAEIQAAIIGRTFVDILMSTEVTGDQSYTGKFMLTQFTPFSASPEGEVTFSLDAKLSGPLTPATIA